MKQPGRKQSDRSHRAHSPKASRTEEVLGKAPAAKACGSQRISRKWSRNYRNLLNLRQDLRNRLGMLAEEASEEQSSYSMHMADSGTDTFDRDFALSMLSSEQSALYEIEEAIKRIENRTYGVCELTGKKIPAERLNAIPWTRFSVEAQKQLERDGEVARPHLGELGTVSGPSAEIVEESDLPEEKPAD